MGQGTIIFILVMLGLLYHIISVIAEAVKRKQEQEKAAELARQRQQGPSDRPDSRPDGAVAGRSRLDELAAKRQAQLDELRARRHAAERGGAAGRTPVQARTGGGATAPPSTARRIPGTPGPMPAPMPRDSRRSGTARPAKDAASTRQTAERQAREAMQRRMQEQGRLQRDAEARRQAEAEAELARRRAAARAERAAGAAGVVSPYALRGAPELQLVRKMLGEPGMLRHAIVLKEIIDRPVSLREGDHLPGHMPAG